MNVEEDLIRIIFERRGEEEVRAAVGRVAESMRRQEEAGDRVAASGKRTGAAMIELGRGLEDFSTGGILGALNNVSRLAELLGPPGLALAVTAAGAALYAFRKPLGEFFASLTGDEVRRFVSQVDQVKERLKELQDKPTKVTLDVAQIDEAERRLDALQKSLAAFERTKETTAGAAFRKEAEESVTGTVGSEAVEAALAKSPGFIRAHVDPQTFDEIGRVQGLIGKIERQIEEWTRLHPTIEPVALEASLDKANEALEAAFQSMQKQAKEAAKLEVGVYAGGSVAAAGRMREQAERGALPEEFAGAVKARAATPAEALQRVEDAKEIEEDQRRSEELARKTRARQRKAREDQQEAIKKSLEQEQEDEEDDIRKQRQAREKAAREAAAAADTRAGELARDVGKGLEGPEVGAALAGAKAGRPDEQLRTEAAARLRPRLAEVVPRGMVDRVASKLAVDVVDAAREEIARQLPTVAPGPGARERAAGAAIEPHARAERARLQREKDAREKDAQEDLERQSREVLTRFAPPPQLGGPNAAQAATIAERAARRSTEQGIPIGPATDIEMRLLREELRKLNQAMTTPPPGAVGAGMRSVPAGPARPAIRLEPDAAAAPPKPAAPAAVAEKAAARRPGPPPVGAFPRAVAGPADVEGMLGLAPGGLTGNVAIPGLNAPSGVPDELLTGALPPELSMFADAFGGAPGPPTNPSLAAEGGLSRRRRRANIARSAGGAGSLDPDEEDRARAAGGAQGERLAPDVGEVLQMQSRAAELSARNQEEMARQIAEARRRQGNVQRALHTTSQTLLSNGYDQI